MWVVSISIRLLCQATFANAITTLSCVYNPAFYILRRETSVWLFCASSKRCTHRHTGTSQKETCQALSIPPRCSLTTLFIAQLSTSTQRCRGRNAMGQRSEAGRAELASGSPLGLVAEPPCQHQPPPLCHGMTPASSTACCPETGAPRGSLYALGRVFPFGSQERL